MEAHYYKYNAFTGEETDNTREISKEEFYGKKNVPDWIRTNGLPLRRRTLYPAELRRHITVVLYPLFSKLSTEEADRIQ